MFSFLKSRNSISGLTGIEFRENGISLVRVLREPGRLPRVMACEFRPLNGAEEQDRVLARLVAEFSLKRSRCTTVLNPEEYTLLLTEAPDVPPDELRSAVRWRIKDLIDFHLDDAAIDVFDVTAANAPGRTRSMYVVAARNTAIQRRVDLCDTAGVGLDVIDIPEMAQRNLAAIVPEDVRGMVMLTLGSQRGLITITRQGELFLSRRVEIGADSLKAAGDRYPYFDQIVLEIQRSLDYFDSHFRQAHVDNLVLSPSANGVPGLVDYLNSNLNIKGRILNLSDVVQFEPEWADTLAGPAWTALGAALRHEEKAL